MRPGFRNTLMDYNKATVDIRKAPQQAVQKRDRIRDDLMTAMHREIRETKTPRDVQFEVLAIQEEKQDLMEELHAQLKRIDRGESTLENVTDETRYVIQEGDQLFVETADKRRVPVSIGDILTDHAWGIEYDLDPKTTKRTTQKKVAIERTRQKVQELLDEQIKVEESASLNNHEFLRGAYGRSLADSKDKNRSLPFGILAEKVLLQLVRKWVIDDNLNFKVEAGDAEHDIAKKIDFVISRLENPHTRGVRIEEEHNLHVKGIQFTIKDNPEELAHKQQQIDRSKRQMKRDKTNRIDDLMLVTLQSGPIGTAYNRWRKLGKPPGGPAKLLPVEAQRQIFNEFMKGLIDEKETEAFWQQAA